MRKTAIIAALALAFLAAPSLAMATPNTTVIQEQDQSAEQQVEGNLQAVDLEGMEITVADSMGNETTVTISEDTTVSGPDGPLTVADLQGKEGSDVVVHCVDDGDGLEALSIQLLA